MPNYPVVAQAPAKKGRGRPKGSPNKVKFGPMTQAQYLKTLVKDEVKKEAAKEQENKYIVRRTPGNAPTGAYSLYPTPSQGMNSMVIRQGTLINDDFYRLLPTISQGVSTLQRIGTVIRPKYMRSHLQFALQPSTEESLNLQVRVIAFTLKSVKSYAEFDNTGLNYASVMFWDGQTGLSNGNPGGHPAYLNYPVNKREFNVVDDITFTLAKGTGQARQTQGGSTAGAQVCVNAYEQTKQLDVVWDTPSTFKYIDQTSQYPSNFAPYIAVFYTQMDGGMSTKDDENLDQVVMNIGTSISYEDA
nr:MAG: capsid protein [Cressdnaviricota sp.]